MLILESSYLQLMSQARRCFTIILLLAGLADRCATAQVLSFTPGQVSAVSSLTGSVGPAYNGPVSGLTVNYGQTLTFDARGDLFIVDAGASVVRVVASGKGKIPVLPSVASPVAGTVYTVAGSGANLPSSTPLCPQDQRSSADGNFYGNGCPATNAVLSLILLNLFNGGPEVAPNAGAALDANGNLYIADSWDNQIRVVYAGGSIPGLPSGLTPGNIYSFVGVANQNPNASFGAPTGVAVDPFGNVYIVYENVPAQGGPILDVVYGGVTLPPGLPSSTNVGDVNPVPYGGATPWQYPFAVASDASGNIYVSDTDVNVTPKVSVFYVGGTLPGVSGPASGDVYPFAGGGNRAPYGPNGVTATSIKITDPAQVTFDAAGNTYLVDFGGSYLPTGLIEKVDPSGSLTVLAGDQSGANCPASSDNYGDGCLATMMSPAFPAGVALASNGDVYFTDSYLIHKIDVTATALQFTAFAGASAPMQVVSVSNAGSQALQMTALQVPSPFAQVPAGNGSDCSASTSLAPGQTCQLGVVFSPASVGSFSGTITITSNSTNATSGNNTITLAGTATLAANSVALSVAPALANVGQPVTLTAAITPPFGDTIAPSGTVTFLSGASSLGTGSVSSNAATLVVSTLPAGTYTLSASYSGDSNYLPSTSDATTLVVSSKQVPTVTLTASASSITAGQTATFTATVTPYSGTTTPIGSVSFTDGVNALGSAPLNSGVATFSTSTLPLGANTIYAVYSGDANFSAASSAGSALQVQSTALLVLDPGVISALAGSFGNYGYAGDGGPAVNSQLNNPSGVSVDLSGNVYIGDSRNNVVRVIASGKGAIPGISNPTNGDIYTVAGSGNLCTNNGGILSCGDGGPATSAGSNLPNGVWADAFGNLYIADSEQTGLVRKVNSAGVISTVAGNLNTNATPPNLGDGGPATSATLSSPVYGIRTDNSGNLYIADAGNNLVRRVDALTGTITTVAGSQSLGAGYSGDGSLATSAQLFAPLDVALDAAGNLFIADAGNNVVRRVDALTGVITTVAGSQSLGAGYSGDGGLAISAQLHGPSGVSVDGGSNLFIGDTSNNVVRRVDAQSGVISTVAGVAGQFGTNGDGGLATAANLNQPHGVEVDAQGNLFIADTSDQVVWEVPAAGVAVKFGSQPLGSTTTQTFTVGSAGSQALNISAINFPDGFVQQPSGGTDCSAPATLNPGQSCELTIAFFPTSGTAFSGSVTLASNSSNATSGVNSIAVSGTGIANTGTTPQTISFTPPTAAAYGQQIALNASASSGLPVVYLVTGPGKVVGSTLTVTGAGAIMVTAYQFGNATYAAASPVSGAFTAVPAPLTVTANSFSRAPGTANPALTYTITGFVNGDTQATATTGAPVLSTTATQSSPPGTYPITIQQGTLQALTANYALTGSSFINGTLTITAGQTQTITFPAISGNLVYGASPITLQATTSAPGLQVSYTVQGPATITGSILTITGAGAVAVTANQPGDATYAPAQPVTQSIAVAPAPLTFTANNLSMAQGAVVPTLTYTVSGLVNGDAAASVVNGTPTLTTTATSSSPVGTVAPITITQGSVTVSTSYAIGPASFVNGTLTVVTGTSQSITFGTLPSVTYGVPPFALSASASSGLPVTYSVSGPASLVNNTLTITGAGTVSVTAAQGGNATYTAALPVQQTLIVGQAALTVTANNATRVNNTPNPAFTYSVSGFVNGDTIGVVSGSPLLTTTATPGSPVGTYPITPALGSLGAVNYTVANLVPGTLTVTSGGPAADFSMALAPQQLTIVDGRVQQTTLTVNSVNYYQGVLNLSCKSLPANVSCIFSPAALTVAPYTTGSSPVPVQGTLTITTSSAPVVGLLSPAGRPLRSAPMAGWASLLFGTLIGWRRKAGQRKGWRRGGLARYALVWAIAALLFGATLSLTACGGAHSSSNGSSLAAPGTSTIQVVATDSNGGPSHTLNLVITVH